jgi:hypothetical protein
MEIDQSWKSYIFERLSPFLIFERAVNNPIPFRPRKLIASLDQLDAFPAFSLILDLLDMRNDGREYKFTRELSRCPPLAGGYCQESVDLVTAGARCQRKLRNGEPIRLK